MLIRTPRPLSQWSWTTKFPFRTERFEKRSRYVSDTKKALYPAGERLLIRVGFEPTRPVKVYSIFSGAHSATLPPVHSVEEPIIYYPTAVTSNVILDTELRFCFPPAQRLPRSKPHVL